MSYFNVPRFDVPELLRTPDESKVFHEVWLSVSAFEGKEKRFSHFFLNFHRHPA
jgi:hypothetical protein